MKSGNDCKSERESITKKQKGKPQKTLSLI